MPVQDVDSGVASEEEFHPVTDLTCNCELCHARILVSSKQNTDEENACLGDHRDGFHLLPSPKSITPNPPSYGVPVMYPWPYHMPIYAEMLSVGGSPYGKYISPPGPKCFPDDLQAPSLVCEPAYRPAVTPLMLEPETDLLTSAMPQVYISKDCVLHIRLSTYVSFERSISAYRLINYRNNSALALNESGEYGYTYHYNCRGLINMHHGKLSITFDKDRQVLLRSEKPSFVKKEMEYYRLTSHHWTACRPVSMDTFDRDRTPEILKKVGNERSADDAKLRELVSTSAVHKEGCGLVSDAKIEQKVNGDVVLSWFYEDRANSLIVSPISGSFSLSTKNLEIMATPKADIYISFADFFAHVGMQQMIVSSGAVVGRYGNMNFHPRSHPCLLKLTSTNADNQSQDLRQYCAFSQPMGGGGSGVATGALGSTTGNTPNMSNYHHHYHRRHTPGTAHLGYSTTSTSSPINSNIKLSPLSQNSAENAAERAKDDEQEDTTTSSPTGNSISITMCSKE